MTTLSVTTLSVTTLPVTTLPATTLPATTLPATTLPATTPSVLALRDYSLLVRPQRDGGLGSRPRAAVRL